MIFPLKLWDVETYLFVNCHGTRVIFLKSVIWVSNIVENCLIVLLDKIKGTLFNECASMPKSESEIRSVVSNTLGPQGLYSP